MNNNFILRAWDRETKKFASVASLVMLRYGQVDAPDRHYSFSNDDYDRFEFCRFTGLFDNNNKPIFENDIVKTIYDADKIGKVVFSSSLASFRVASLTRELSMPIVTYRVNENSPNEGKFLLIIEEVIGNVFENPELIS